MFLTSPYIEQAIALKIPLAGSTSAMGILQQLGLCRAAHHGFTWGKGFESIERV